MDQDHLSDEALKIGTEFMSQLAIESGMILKRLAELSPLTDTELMRNASGAKPYLTQDDIDLSLALYHERTGQHENGCDVCDMEHMASLVAEYAEAKTSDSRIAHHSVG